MKWNLNNRSRARLINKLAIRNARQLQKISGNIDITFPDKTIGTISIGNNSWNHEMLRPVKRKIPTIKR